MTAVAARALLSFTGEPAAVTVPEPEPEPEQPFPKRRKVNADEYALDGDYRAEVRSWKASGFKLEWI